MNAGVKEALGALAVGGLLGLVIAAVIRFVPAPWNFVAVGALILGGSLWFGRR